MLALLERNGLTEAWQSGQLTEDEHDRIAHQVESYVVPGQSRLARVFLDEPPARADIDAAQPDATKYEDRLRERRRWFLMLAAALPGPLLARWRAGTLKPAQTRQALNRLTQRATQSLQRGGQQLLGQLTPAGQLPGPPDRQAIDAWAVAMTAQQRALYQAALRLVIGDREPTAQEVRLLRQYLDRQFGYLRNFQRAITTGRQARNGTLATRMGLYGQTVRGFASEVQRLHATLQGMRYEINRMGAVEHHCSECPEITALGWQPIGSLKPVGERECLVNCKCYLEFAREKPSGIFSRLARFAERLAKPHEHGHEPHHAEKRGKRSGKPRGARLAGRGGNCGTGAGGFQPGNTCGRQAGGAGTGERPFTPRAERKIAKVRYNLHAYDPEAGRKLLGYPPERNDFARLVGAQPGSHLTVVSEPDGSLSVLTQHDEYMSLRQIYRDGSNRLVIHNDTFLANRMGTGLGLKVFYEQVRTAGRLGVSRIETSAARDDSPGDTKIGYKVWPRFGYDAPLGYNYRRELPGSLGHLRQEGSRISDLMKTSEGRDWWDQHGHTSVMEFDTRPGSQSRRVLAAYVREKRRKGAAGAKRLK